jgi:thiol-disulfide isomerase/thioredoxin
MHGSGSRHLLLIGSAALLAAAGVAYLTLAPGSQPQPQRLVQSAENLSFEFDPMVVDLGEIPLGETRSAQVRIRNIAAGPREITVAAPSCACTKATWPEDPIPVGGTAESTVSQTPTGAVGEVVKKTVAYVIRGGDNAGERAIITVQSRIGPAAAPPAPAATVAPAPAPAPPVPPAPPVAPAPPAVAPAPPTAAPAAVPPANPAPAARRAPFGRTNPPIQPGARIAFPQLDAFVKGDARSAFEPGRLYVFDFFETTCSHCKEYAPLITRLAREFGAKGVEFIAITPEDPEKVRAWLAQPGKLDEVPYSVASDADRSAMATLQGGTYRSFNPRFFVVRDGIVQWFGHPKLAEAPLAAMVAGTWSPESVRAEMVTESLVARAKNYLDAAARECDASGDWTPMFAALDSVRTAIPERAGQYDAQRFVILIGLAGKPDEGYEYGRRIAREYAQDMVTQRSLARAVLQSPYAKRRELDFGMECALAADALAKGEDARAADTVALAWFSKGDRAKAVEHGERAVRLEKDPKQRVQYEQALRKYRTAPLGPEPTKVRTPGGGAASTEPGTQGAAGD